MHRRAARQAVLKMQINKSDRNDAAGIARIMQTGWFKEVCVKNLDSHAVKALLASRALLVRTKRDLENQVRCLLKNLGLVIGRAKFNVRITETKIRRRLSDTDKYTRISQTLLVAKRRYVLSKSRIKRVDKDIIGQQASDNGAKVPVRQERVMWLVAVDCH